MLIHGLIDIQDWNLEPGSSKRRPLRSCLLSKKVNGNYYVCVKNSMYPSCINYRMADLDQVHSKFAAEGKLSMRFKLPRHLVLVQADDVNALNMFLRQVRDIVNGKNVVIGTRQMPKTVPAKKDVSNRFDPSSAEFVAVDRFDRRILNMRHLNKLLLENCVLPNLPTQIGHLPIAYLSLSGSKLAASRYDQDTIWDWMSSDTITSTLTTLKMDSVGLLTLPFEISFLRKLQTLSVANNKLTYLPQYIGELKKLQTLYVSDNMLNYFPACLYPRTFNLLDISNNSFMGKDSLLNDHILYMQSHNEPISSAPVVKKLSHLSFYSLLDNCIKFKRQDIPRSLWHYFNIVARCVHCHKFVLPDCNRILINHSIGSPSTLNLIKNHTTNNIAWQSVVCRFRCSESQKM